MAKGSYDIDDELMARARYHELNLSKICRAAILSEVVRVEAVEMARWQNPDGFKQWEEELLKKYMTKVKADE